MKLLINDLINDAAHGEYYCLSCILKYYVEDLGIPVERIIGIADRYFNIPHETAVYTLEVLGITTIH